jgi:hypothetical protein
VKLILEQDIVVSFNRDVIELDDCVSILRSVVHQGLTDLKLFSTKPSLRDEFLQTVDFFMDDNYCIDWGDKQLTFSQIAEIINIDIYQVRRFIKQQYFPNRDLQGRLR